MPNNKRLFGFDHADAARAMDEFERTVGEKHEWFVLCVKQIGVLNREFDPKITEIIIGEMEPIKIIDPLPTEYILIEGKEFTPTGNQITALVRQLLDIEETDLDKIYTEDFSLAIYGFGSLRINFSCSESGYELSLRYHDFIIRPLVDLGYPLPYIDWFRKFIRYRTLKNRQGQERTCGMIDSGGLILHIDKTGSGKSTGISAEMNELSRAIDGKIVAYENPPEHRYVQTKASVSQYDLNVHMKAQGSMSQLDTVKSNLLRKKPSAVLYSEVKTDEEIFEVIHLGCRGPIVFSTLHTSNAGEALAVMSSVMGAKRALLAGSLRAIVSHYMYLSIKGDLVPLYEIFIPNAQAKKYIYDDKIDDIKRLFYNEKTFNVAPSINFKTHLDSLVLSGTLTEQDKKEVLSSMMIDTEGVRK